MQKLPEVSDRKKGRRMRKEKGPLDKRRTVPLFQAVTSGSDNTLLTSGTPRARLWTTRWLVLSLVALVSVNNIPKYKSYEKDLSNNKLKHWTWTNSQKRLTPC